MIAAVGSGSTWNDWRVVTVQEELEADLMHLIRLGKRERPTNEAGQTLAQGVVLALHVRQLATTLLAHRFV